MNIDLIPMLDPTPIPGPEWLFHGLLVFTFFIHLLFLNLTLGGTLLAAVAHLASGGRREDPRAVLARRLTAINTYGVSLTITTGVAPLLFVQLLFQQYFYTATILIAPIWLGLVLLLMIGYYALYVHKFAGRSDDRPTRGVWISLSALLFLAVGMIQVAVNLIHSQPGRWEELSRGSWSVLADPLYFPRLLHFLLAAIGFSAVVCAWWAVREANRDRSVELNGQIAAYTWRWVLWTVVLEIVIGFALLLMLPGEVLGGLMRGGATTLLPLTAAILLAIGLLVMISRVRDPQRAPGVVSGVMGAMLLAIAFMAMTRHSVRVLYLAPLTSQFESGVAPQWGNFVLFAVLLVAGLATVAYMVRRVIESAASGSEAA